MRRGNGLRHVFGMKRSAAGIDVAAIGCNMEEVGGNSAIAKDQRRDAAGGPVGAIHQHAQLAEIGSRDEVRQPMQRIVHAVGRLPASISACRYHIVGCSRRQLLDVGEDIRLDGVLQFVGELIAVGPEDLDAVVLPGIVRGGDHDAGGKTDWRA